MKALFVIIACFTALKCFSQQTDLKNVKWENAMTLQQAKEKAKKENKYLFVYCYTTWCGWCRAMEIKIYSNDTVGYYMNQKFVSIKIQMDKTGWDDSEIKRLYPTAEFIKNEFQVDGYPTLLVFTPEGRLVEKHSGATTNIKSFLELMERSLVPGKIYKERDREYFNNVRPVKPDND